MEQKHSGPERDIDKENIVTYLRDHKEWTFQEIGNSLGVTRQRVHAIYSRWKKEVEADE